MKKIFFTFGLLLTACTDSYHEEFNNIAGLDVNCVTIEPMSRASTSDITDKIIYIIMSGEEIVTTIEQTKENANYGKLSADLETGNYKLLIYATNSITPIVVNNDGTINVTKCGQAYSYSGEFTIIRDKRTIVSATLNRCVAKLSVTSLEDLPSNINKMRIILMGNSTTYDIEAGKGINTTSYDTNIININKSFVINNKLTFDTYALLPDTVATLTISINFYENDTLISTKEFSDIPMKVNCKTNLSAALFHEHGVDGDNNITINTEWGEPINIER